MFPKSLVLALGLALTTPWSVAQEEEKILNIYNWSDYIAEDTIRNFEKETGIKVRYDNFDNNEIVHAKLVAGKTGYDIVIPSSNWAKLQADGGLLRKLDKAQLPNLRNLDPTVQAQLARLDPGNEFMVNWLWGFTTVGINVEKVKAALGLSLIHISDEVFLFKRTVREVALRHDMFATFMAKPIAGEPGSAMHIHQSVVDKATGRNIFSNEDGTPSREFYWYIGGLQRYTPAAMALLAPYVNSYRRLVRGVAAPINIQWGIDNRTVGIRSPLAPAAARRVENRVIGADANPYVALAATLACGYLGILNRIEPTAECKGDAYLGDFQLPRSLGEALALLRAEKDLSAVLGEGFITVYTEVKEVEYAEFMKVISPWEREHLLLHV